MEDNPAQRRVLALALADEGYTVHSAVHGRHALRQLEALAPCLILLDLRMLVMDGAAFTRADRARDGADAPIVVPTAESRPDGLAEIVPAAGAARRMRLRRRT